MRKKIQINFLLFVFIIIVVPINAFATETIEESSAIEETETTASEVETEPEKINISSLPMLAIENQIYQGKSCKPTVKIDGLKENKDYKVKYKNNKKPGKATISVIGIGNYCGSVQLTFKINLDTVRNLKYENVSDGIKIHWQKVAGADGYIIYRKTNKNSSWRKVSQTNKNSWTDKNVVYGKEYFYTIRAFAQAEDSILKGEYNENGIKAKFMILAPKLKETISKESSVIVKWDKVKGATKYYVYRKNKSTSKWKKIASVKNISYEDKTVKKGEKYLYTVKSVYKNVESKYDEKGLQGAVLAGSVTMKSIFISSTGKATIKWDKINNVDGYLIYRKTSNGKWQKVGNTSSNKATWSEIGLKKDKQYSYKVAGYRLLNSKKVVGEQGTSMTPKLDYGGEYVKNVTKTYLGISGAGRKMYSYTIGTGKNHVVITMAIHGWEDSWAKDAIMLVKTGNRLISDASKNLNRLKNIIIQLLSFLWQIQMAFMMDILVMDLEDAQLIGIIIREN